MPCTAVAAQRASDTDADASATLSLSLVARSRQFGRSNSPDSIARAHRARFIRSESNPNHIRALHQHVRQSTSCLIGRAARYDREDAQRRAVHEINTLQHFRSRLDLMAPISTLSYRASPRRSVWSMSILTSFRDRLRPANKRALHFAFPLGPLHPLMLRSLLVSPRRASALSVHAEARVHRTTGLPITGKLSDPLPRPHIGQYVQCGRVRACPCAIP